MLIAVLFYIFVLFIAKLRKQNSFFSSHFVGEPDPSPMLSRLKVNGVPYRTFFSRLLLGGNFTSQPPFVFLARSSSAWQDSRKATEKRRLPWPIEDMYNSVTYDRTAGFTSYLLPLFSVWPVHYSITRLFFSALFTRPLLSRYGSRTLAISAPLGHPRGHILFN